MSDTHDPIGDDNEGQEAETVDDAVLPDDDAPEPHLEGVIAPPD